MIENEQKKAISDLSVLQIMDSSKVEPAIITAIRLARLRDGNMGQADEIEALFGILKGSEKLMNVTNDVVWALLTKKQNMSQIDRRITLDEGYSILKDSFDKFVTAKIKRIEKFIRYFQILEQDVTEEDQKLRKFEKEWETIRRQLDELNIDHYLSISREDSYNQVNAFKNDVMKTSLPIAQELNELENQMQRKVIGMIAFLAKETKPMDTNELYKLLTGEPQKPNVRYVPSQTIEEGWTYVSIPDDETVLGLRLAVTKVMKILKPDGSPAVDGNGNPIYTYNSVPVVRVLTKEEYEVEKKRGFLK